MYMHEIPDFPDIMQMDNGTEFKGATSILMQMLNVKIVHGRPYAPHVQGKVMTIIKHIHLHNTDSIYLALMRHCNIL